jgi:DNA repair exonuclease SbcCD nuclease subunit
MKISIFSDCHTGFAYGEERGEDSFKALEECIEKSMDSDLILIAGDIFDTRIPKQEVLAKTARILSKAQQYQSKAKLIEILNKEEHEASPLALRGIPILALHGNHERRAKFLINPVQALEHAGLLIHLNQSTAVFEIDGQKIAVHGMSNVPEMYSRETLREWNPKPIENALNIFMLHQNVGEYIYTPLEPPSMVLNDLPKGFDLYILGHTHWSDKMNLSSGQFLLTGSTAPTTIHKIESEMPKYFHIFDGKINSFPIECQRKIIWKEFEFEGGIREKVENFLATIPLQNPKPIVFVRIKGKIPRETLPPNFSDIEERFKDRVIVNLSKSFEVEGFEEQVELLRMLRDQKLSPEEHGLKILQDFLKQNNCKIKIEEIFEYLITEEPDSAFNMLFK